MDDCAGLLEPIRRNPADMTVRKVLADQQEDAGNSETASLVRRYGIVGPILYGGVDRGCGDGGSYGDGGGYKNKLSVSEGFAMTDGLCIIAVPGGWAPYVIVGWAERYCPHPRLW